MSGWSNTEHAYNMCKLPAAYGAGAYAVIGHYIDAVHNYADYAVFFTVDGGQTFKLAMYPTTTNNYGSSSQACFVLNDVLYVSANGKLWQWTGVIPGDWSNWNDYLKPTSFAFTSYTIANNTQIHTANGTVAVLTGTCNGMTGTLLFDGKSLWSASSVNRLWAVTTHTDGYIYGVSPLGLFRTLDGRTWYRNTGTSYPTASLPTFLSLAVDSKSIWGGTADSKIWSFAPTAGPWQAI